jgi:enediyne polyketide synthase
VPRPRAAGHGEEPRAVPRPGEATGDPTTAATPATATPATTRATITSAATADGTVWDIEAVDQAGRPLITWRGLVIRDAGPLPQTTPWPIPLLPGYLERTCTALGLGPALEIQIRHRGRTGSAPTSEPTESGQDWVQAAADDAALTGISLRVRAAGPAACGWQTVRRTAGRGGFEYSARSAGSPGTANAGASRPTGAADSGRAPDQTAETALTAAARQAAMAACLRAASAPAGLVLGDPRSAGDGWLLLNAGGATIACTVLELSGVHSPVAIAVMTGTPLIDGRPSAVMTGRKRPAGQVSKSRS